VVRGWRCCTVPGRALGRSDDLDSAWQICAPHSRVGSDSACAAGVHRQKKKGDAPCAPGARGSDSQDGWSCSELVLPGLSLGMVGRYDCGDKLTYGCSVPRVACVAVSVDSAVAAAACQGRRCLRCCYCCFTIAFAFAVAVAGPATVAATVACVLHVASARLRDTTAFPSTEVVDSTPPPLSQLLVKVIS
jgi:hypothetical protein